MRRPGRLILFGAGVGLLAGAVGSLLRRRDVSSGEAVGSLRNLRGEAEGIAQAATRYTEAVDELHEALDAGGPVARRVAKKMLEKEGYAFPPKPR